MGQNKIIEGNKLIAEFMKNPCKIWEDPDPVLNTDYHCTHLERKGVGIFTVTYNFGFSEADAFQEELTDSIPPYNFSWDWLMPVVEKIESLGYDFSIDNCYVRIWDGGQSDFEMTFSEPTKLLTTYFAVIEFIKWYNNERK